MSIDTRNLKGTSACPSANHFPSSTLANIYRTHRICALAYRLSHAPPKILSWLFSPSAPPFPRSQTIHLLLFNTHEQWRRASKVYLPSYACSSTKSATTALCCICERCAKACEYLTDAISTEGIGCLRIPDWDLSTARFECDISKHIEAVL